MKYKLVALDLDGTLLNNESEITQYTVDILKKLSSRGIHIIIATGRSYTSLKPKIAGLDIGDPIICYNGAMIRDSKNDDIIMSSSVPDSVSRELIKISRKENIHFHGFLNGDFHYEKESKESKGYKTLSGLNGVVSNFDDFENLYFTKCMFIGKSESLLKIESVIRPLFYDKSYIAFSKPTFLEVMNVEASKAKSLDLLVKQFGLTSDQVIAFGDGLNDLDMLQYAGKGVVMKNGYETLKLQFENSKFTNNENGVAKYLEQLLND